MKEDLLLEYRDKLSAAGDSDGTEFFLKDFLDETKLADIIAGMTDYERTLTKAGYQFLEDYYGLDRVVSIVQKEWLDFPFDYKESPVEYLKMKKGFTLD